MAREEGSWLPRRLTLAAHMCSRRLGTWHLRLGLRPPFAYPSVRPQAASESGQRLALVHPLRRGHRAAISRLLRVTANGRSAYSAPPRSQRTTRATHHWYIPLPAMTSSSDIPTIHAGGGPLASVPDDVTIPQFFLDGYHPLNGEALQLRKSAYFIEDATGREFNGDQVSLTPLALVVGPRQRARRLDGLRAFRIELLDSPSIPLCSCVYSLPFPLRTRWRY